MHVRVLYFGVLREILKLDAQRVELPEAASAETLLETIRRTSPGNDGLWRSLLIAVNQEYAASGATLSEDDEVALLPPVSGGTGSDEAGLRR